MTALSTMDQCVSMSEMRRDSEENGFVVAVSSSAGSADVSKHGMEDAEEAANCSGSSEDGNVIPSAAAAKRYRTIIDVLNFAFG